MSGNPRWMYCCDGSGRELKDYSALLAELKQRQRNGGRERAIGANPVTSAGSRAIAQGAARRSAAGVGVRVPAADLERLQERFKH